jgi:hypothetical protein
MHPPGPSVATNLDGGGDEGGSLLYQFRTEDFSLTWHDSAGPLKENNPEVFDLFRRLPVTDVEVGAILGFNQPFNGLRDPAMYIDAIDPKIFVPLHHDFVTEYGSANDYEPTLRKELASLGPLPELRWLSDPGDYIRPGLLTFDVHAPQWAVGDGARPAGEKCKKPKD